jgi:hypothetical protein
MFNSEMAQKKWAPLLEHSDCAPIKDSYRKAVTAVLLENQEKAIRETNAQANFMTEANDTVASNVKNFDPVLVALVRRAMPSLIAYDVAGVQPMSGPTGLIFSMVPTFTSDKGSVSGRVTPAPALVDEADPRYSGDDRQADEQIIDDDDSMFGSNVSAVAGGAGRGYTTAEAEALSGDEDDATSPAKGFGTMGFKIDKSTVTAKTRALKAGYSMELAQDLKAIHGLDAESELANILSTEILAEINREVIQTIRGQSVTSVDGDAAGTFDLTSGADVLGARWAQEKFQALVFQIEKEANLIGTTTRRGKGNFVIVSPNVGSALAASGALNYTGSTNTGLTVDVVGNTFAGTLNGNLKVYIDPYQSTDQVIVGYRGASPYDAGLFYCPYVPLTMVKAVGEEDFQPRIAFKTRYGLVSNPLCLANGASQGADFTGELASAGTNVYFRKFTVSGI